MPDTREQGKPLARAVRDGAAQLIRTFGQARQYRYLFGFLIARMIYIDGLATVFDLFGTFYLSASEAEKV